MNVPNSRHDLSTVAPVNHSSQSAADHGGLIKCRGQNEGNKIKENAGGRADSSMELSSNKN